MHPSVSTQRHQLCLDQPRWTRTIAALTENPSLVAIGSMAVERTIDRWRLVVNDLQVVQEIPHGTHRPALDTWCVVVLASDRGRQDFDADGVVSQFVPKFSQHFVLLVVGMGHNRDGWMGWSINRDAIEPLTDFQVIGTRGFEASTQIDDEQTEFVMEENAERWSRVSGAIGSSYPSVRVATVGIVGCSRSGTIAATQFAALGVRKLVLFDGDNIEAHNLDGCYLATPGDIEMRKATVLADRLLAYRPDLSIGVVERAFSEHGAIESNTPLDLLVTCVDNEDARIAASQIASRRLIPHLDIATELSVSESTATVAHADVRFFCPRDGCVGCVGGTRLTANGEFQRQSLPGVLSPHRSAPWHQQRRGSLITVNSIAVSTGVQTWLASLQGQLTASTWHRLAWGPDGSLRMDSAPVSPAESCKICEKSDATNDLGDRKA